MESLLEKMWLMKKINAIEMVLLRKLGLYLWKVSSWIVIVSVVMGSSIEPFCMAFTEYDSREFIPGRILACTPYVDLSSDCKKFSF